MDLEIGQVFVDRYFVNRLVGRGSTGQVYEARDSARGGRVAIRMLQSLTLHGSVFNEREAVTAGRLANPHLAEFVRVEPLSNGELCLISQFVDGESLERKIQRVGRITPFGLSQLLLQLLDGLTAAHRAGIIHRDLTPRSVFFLPATAGATATFKLIDFGLSRFDWLKLAADPARVLLDRERQSLQYLSPEQLEGVVALDARSNVYSLGVIAYHAITGRLPFQGADFATLISEIGHGEAIPVEEYVEQMSPTLAQLIRRAMAPSPSERFQSAEEMHAAAVALAEQLAPPTSEADEGDSLYFPSAEQLVPGEGDAESTGQERPALISTVRAAEASTYTEASEPSVSLTDRLASASKDVEEVGNAVQAQPGASAVANQAASSPRRSDEGVLSTERASRPRGFDAAAHAPGPASAPSLSGGSEPLACLDGELPKAPGSFRLRQSTVPGIQPSSGPIHELPAPVGRLGEENTASAVGPSIPSGDLSSAPPQVGDSASMTASAATERATASTAPAKARTSAAPTTSKSVAPPNDLNRAALPPAKALPRTTEQARALAAQRAARRSASVRPPAESRPVVVAASDQPKESEVEPRAEQERPSQSRKQVAVALALALFAGGGVLLAWLYGRPNEEAFSTAPIADGTQPRAAAAATTNTGAVSLAESTETAPMPAVSAPVASGVANDRKASTSIASPAPAQHKTQGSPRAAPSPKKTPSSANPTKKSNASRRDSAKDPYNYR